LKNLFKKADVIVGANVFCHIPDQPNLIKSIDKLLSANGTIIFEEPYLGAMYKKTSYDQIYDEHIYMFSLSSIKKIYDLFGFELIDAIPQITHGGSMRYILKRKGIAKKSQRLLKLLKLERIKKINKFSACLLFKNKVMRSKYKLKKKIIEIKKKGFKICGYGATSKSTTILNFCKINKEMIDCIFDTTKEKIGKFTPGTHIPILDYNQFKNSNYKYVFLFAWNHKKEIMRKEKQKKYIKWFTHLD
jgi:methylation protein EvaC